MSKKEDDVVRIGFYVRKSDKKELEDRAKHEGITLTALIRPFIRPIAKGELQVKPERIK